MNNQISFSFLIEDNIKVQTTKRKKNYKIEVEIQEREEMPKGNIILSEVLSIKYDLLIRICVTVDSCFYR